MNPTQKILIVGGGFGGVKAALELADNPNFAVTLLSDRTDFRYYAALYQTATGGRRTQTSIPLQTLFDQKNVDLRYGQVVTLNRDAKSLTALDGANYTYDTLILGLGVVTNYFGIKGLEQYSYSIKSTDEAERFKRHLHEQMIDDKAPDHHYVIVGGGPTGIELAGALPGYLRNIMERHGIKHRAIHIELVEAMPALLPRMPKSISRAVKRRLHNLGVKVYLNQAVQGETAESLIVNGKPIATETVVWTAGVTNNPFFKQNNFVLSDRGKVVVNEYLQAEPNVYILGDNASTQYAGLAQTALYDAVYVAKNLKRIAAGENTVSYRPKQPISVIPAGPGWAAVVWGKAKFSGFIGGLLREAADFIAFRDYEPWWKAASQWAKTFGEEDSCPVCQLRERNPSSTS